MLTIHTPFNSGSAMSLQKRLGLATAPLFLMDGTAFIYRAFYAQRDMQRSDGFPTNAIYVVARLLLRLLREEKPEHFLVLMDGRGQHFRHELFPLYKANREATPEALVQQLEPIRRFIAALGLAAHVSEGCEADDCIASLSARFAAQKPVIIIGADKDLRQCLAPTVYLWDPAAREEKLLSLNSFYAESGLKPEQWPDVQALLGDSSDNIPGVPGIGPKTAEKLFKDFPNLEAIRDGFEQLPPKLQDKFRPHLDSMFLYRRLTTLRRDVCARMELADLALGQPQARQLEALCLEFEMTSLRRELENFIRSRQVLPNLPKQEAAPRKTVPTTQQGSPQQDSPQQGSLAQARQASLFSFAPPQAPLPLLTDTQGLPDCSGLKVGLVPPTRAEDRAFSLALAGREWRYIGSLPKLLTFLARAKAVVSPDIKQLCKNSALWRPLLPLCLDLSLAAYLVAPEERDYSWLHLCSQWAQQPGCENSGPALLALSMAEALEKRLQAEGLSQLYHELELPLVPVLAALEQRGIKVDLAAFSVFLDEVQKELDRLTAELYAAAGGPFNIRSAQQLGELLFGKLGLAPAGKTRGGQLSTAQDALEKLSGLHPLVDGVLEYRKLEKLRSTYLAPLPRLVDANGRIHTCFNQLATATGRLSSSNPNLQNIPVRGPFGQRMRACFVAQEGMALLSADYSQVELRVLAHMSQDEALLEAFRQGTDIHARTAALLYDLELENVSPEQRRNAKTINFGLIYGMGSQKLAQELKISLSEARAFIERYFSRMSTLKKFYEQIEASAKAQGFVSTLAGRRRHLPDIHSKSHQHYALARRQAINTVIQGSAADVIKLAMLAVEHDPALAGMNARLLLQVHDELLLEAPAERAAEAGARVAALMEGVRPGGVSFSVPLLVDWGYGANWALAH